MLAIGSVVDRRYEVRGLLAEGATGPVFRARRVLEGDEVALRMIRATGAEATRLRQRFLREMPVVAGLRHPNLVRIHDFNVDAEGRPYLVMEILNGRSLADEITAEGPLDLLRVQSIVMPLCAALQVVHDGGVRHRDLKPANIVGHRVEPDQQIYKIVDLGLAGFRGAADDTRPAGIRPAVDPVAYTSPERVGTTGEDARSDVYSLGVVLFEALTGAPPFGGDAQAVVAGHLTVTPPPVTRLRPDLPGWIDAVVATALAKHPDDRWASMSALARALAGPPDGASPDRAA